MALSNVVLSLTLLGVVFSVGVGVVYIQAVQLSSHLQGKWVGSERGAGSFASNSCNKLFVCMKDIN